MWLKLEDARGIYRSVRLSRYFTCQTGTIVTPVLVRSSCGGKVQGLIGSHSSTSSWKVGVDRATLPSGAEQKIVTLYLALALTVVGMRASISISTSCNWKGNDGAAIRFSSINSFMENNHIRSLAFENRFLIVSFLDYQKNAGM